MSRGAYTRDRDGSDRLTLSGLAELWPTPAARDEKSGEASDETFERNARPLNEVAARWQTPATDSFRSRGLERRDEMGLDQQARFWPTPNTPNGGRSMALEDVEARGSTARGKRQVDLGSTARFWPTQLGRTESGGGDLQAEAERFFLPDRPSSTSGAKSSQTIRRLNPRFVDWLIGWPLGWTDCGSPATESFRWWLALHSSRLRDVLGW